MTNNKATCRYCGFEETIEIKFPPYAELGPMCSMCYNAGIMEDGTLPEYARVMMEAQETLLREKTNQHGELKAENEMFEGKILAKIIEKDAIINRLKRDKEKQDYENEELCKRITNIANALADRLVGNERLKEQLAAANNTILQLPEIEEMKELEAELNQAYSLIESRRWSLLSARDQKHLGYIWIYVCSCGCGKKIRVTECIGDRTIRTSAQPNHCIYHKSQPLGKTLAQRKENE